MPETDVYGNVVRDGTRRFNYLTENQNTFTRLELDEQNQIISRQNLSTSPFEPPLRPPAEVVFSSAALQAYFASGLSISSCMRRQIENGYFSTEFDAPKDSPPQN